MPHTAELLGLGWKIKVQQGSRNFSITLAREIVLGNLLQKKDELYYYLVNIEGRKAVLLFLDKKPIDDSNQFVIKSAP